MRPHSDRIEDFPAGPPTEDAFANPFGNSSDLAETFFSASTNYGFS
jgi:hypothetical protein